MRRCTQFVLLLFLLSSQAPFALAYAAPMPAHCARLAQLAERESAHDGDMSGAECHGAMHHAPASRKAIDSNESTVSAIFQHCPACRQAVAITVSRKGSVALPASALQAQNVPAVFLVFPSQGFSFEASNRTVHSGRAPPAQK